MSFIGRWLGRKKVDGVQLAKSAVKSDYAQIALLDEFSQARQQHATAEQQRWNRVLPQPYAKTIDGFRRNGWLEPSPAGELHLTAKGSEIVAIYRQRLDRARAEVMPRVRAALDKRDTSQALDLRRSYEDWFALGTAAWTGTEPQLSHSALTRRILFLDHWLLDGLQPDTIEWLKLYAAEQHMWGAYWELPEAEIPDDVCSDLMHNVASHADKASFRPAEAAYWRAHQLALYVDNHETWQRCKGGDHVRRIVISGVDDEYSCDHCRAFFDKQFLVARVPELPHRECTSVRGCRCRYEPVLEMLEDLAP